MNADAYFLPEQANSDDLSSWFPLVPSGVQVISTNLFGDAFFVDGSGAIRMLDRGTASVQTIAAGFSTRTASGGIIIAGMSGAKRRVSS